MNETTNETTRHGPPHGTPDETRSEKRCESEKAIPHNEDHDGKRNDWDENGNENDGQRHRIKTAGNIWDEKNIENEREQGNRRIWLLCGKNMKNMRNMYI